MVFHTYLSFSNVASDRVKLSFAYKAHNHYIAKLSPSPAKLDWVSFIITFPTWKSLKQLTWSPLLTPPPLWTFSWNTFEFWNTLGNCMQDPWQSLKPNWNTLETPLKFPWNTTKTFLEHLVIPLKQTVKNRTTWKEPKTNMIFLRKTSEKLLKCLSKQLSSNFKKYHFAHSLKLSPIYLFRLVHFIILCLYFDV